MLLSILHTYNAAIFIGFGIAYAIAPVSLARLTGLQAINSEGRIDFRAVYGGLTMGIGIFFGLAALGIIADDAALWASIIFYGEIGLFRGLGMLMEKSYSHLFGALLLNEIVVVTLSIAALQSL